MGIRFGLIGAGRMGKVFANTLAYSVAEADLVAVADPDAATLDEVAARYGIPTSYTDYHELLAQKDIEAVVVASPTGTHAEVITAAAQAGKQIFSEKPLSQDLKACDLALAAVKKAGVKLQMGFMRRHDAPYADAKRKILEGVIGQPVMFKATSRDPKRTSLEFARREHSGGMIMDMGVHDFDLARWLMGSEVTRVFSEGTCLAFPELKDVGDIDNAVMNLRFANDGIGNIVEDWQNQLEEITTLETTLDGPPGSIIRVSIEIKVTEIGTLELWCVSLEDGRKWKLEFNVREQD